MPQALSTSLPAQAHAPSPALEAPVLSPLTGVVPVPECDFVVFGGTGDLAMRKLLPALWHRDREGQLPDGARIIAVSRSDADDAGYRHEVEAAVDPAGEEATFARFARRLHHITLDATGDARRDSGWAALSDLLRGGEERVRVFYLATAPTLFGQVSRGLQAAGLVTSSSRVVLEKPIGWDLASARSINDEVGEVFGEQQIFRIDHYLGKETVQNLLVLRFANLLLEPLWNSNWIDHVQITAAETVGTGARSGYYDGSGALRDMVQNHLLQLLCLVAMEPPNRLDRDAVRDEKLKVLQALRPMNPADVARCTVRGQYRAGAVDGEPVPGYSTELGAPSETESFVALKTEVQNWRWAGVPFYLRTGKRMDRRASEIVVVFKAPPHHFKDKFIFADLAEKDCATCHKDPHKGRFGKRCSECHTESGWDETAEFHKNFVLSGVHFMLECADCHRDKRRLSGLGNDCKVCHQKDDVHQGTQPECASCHTQQFWSIASFKHSLTAFPLRGSGNGVKCLRQSFALGPGSALRFQRRLSRTNAPEK